jgi:hypothetical protein
MEHELRITHNRLVRRRLSRLLNGGTSLRQGEVSLSATMRVPAMNISLYPHAAVTKISRFGMAGLLIAFAGIALLGVSHPAYAGPLVYVGTDNTGITFSAYENSGTQTDTVTLPIPTALQSYFTHSQDYIIIDSITPTGFTTVNGDLDDVATGLQYISGTAILGTTHLSATSSDTVTISWLPVDLSGINDADFGLWQGTFVVDLTFYGYPNGYPGPGYPTAYPDTYYENVTFDAQVNDPVPEPTSLYLLGTGLLALAGMLRRKLHRG